MSNRGGRDDVLDEDKLTWHPMGWLLFCVAVALAAIQVNRRPSGANNLDCDNGALVNQTEIQPATAPSDTGQNCR